MLSFTRKTDYALISLAHLVSAQGSCCSAREIALRYKMPMPSLMNILKVLNQRGLVCSMRGPRGGYQLAKPPEQISLYDIIAAVDGPVALVQCLPRPEPSGGKQAKRSAERPQTAHAGQSSGRVSKEDKEDRDCDLKSHCPVRVSVHRVHHHLVGFLKEVTLADIAGDKACRHPSERGATGESQYEVARLS